MPIAYYLLPLLYLFVPPEAVATSCLTRSCGFNRSTPAPEPETSEQARNLVKRVYAPRDDKPGCWDRGPKAKVLIEAHPRQHWKALRQALNLVKRVYVQRDVTPGYWDRGPKA